MTDEQRRVFDALAEFWKAAWTSFDRRRDYEWKVSLGVWTVLATLTGILLTKEIAVESVLVLGWSACFVLLLMGLQAFWQKGVARANDTDRDKADYYAGRMAEELRIPLLPPDLEQKVSLHRRGLKNYSHRFQLSLTFVLGLSLVSVVWFRTHDSVQSVGLPATPRQVSSDQQAQVDNNEVKMTPPPPPCEQPCERHAIVFVHGLFGGIDSWDNGATSFPDILRKDPLCGECDIFMISYPTKPSESNKIRLTDIAKQLAERLDSLGNYKAIHLIGHSMGGNAILISLMFTKFLHDDAHQRLTKYRNIILLGTPIEGSSFANFRRLAELWIGRDPQLVALKPIADNELPVLTELAMATIDAKRASLRLALIPIATAWEEKPLYGVGIIVPRESAEALGTEHKGFAKDHEQLVKPASRCDDVYQWVAGLLATGFGKPQPIYDCPTK